MQSFLSQMTPIMVISYSVQVMNQYIHGYSKYFITNNAD